jgi:protein SCO1/2
LLPALLLACATPLAACGGDDAQLVGYQLEPATDVSDLSLPDAATGEPVAMTAADGELMLMYFGYTACPDVCPTTLASVRSALRKLGDGAERIGLAMATVDPARDTADVLPGYVQSFLPDAVGLRTEDPDELQQVADRFGATYSVTGSGDDTEVTHSGALFVVDDTGTVIDVLPFGVTPDDIRNDLEILLESA